LRSFKINLFKFHFILDNSALGWVTSIKPNIYKKNQVFV